MEEESKAVPNFDSGNYLRLQILLSKSYDILRRLFIKEWNIRSGVTKWEDSDSNRKDFINGPGKELYQGSGRIQKEHLSSRNITEWDLPLLIQSVKSLKAHVPYKIFEELKDVRNKLAHLGEPKVSNEKYDEYWKQLCILLLKLDFPQEEIDKIKSAPIEPLNESPQPVDPKIKKLKNLGNEAFNKKRFGESIDFYTEVICTPGVSNKDLAILYSNRSIAFLKLGDILSAKQDAKGSIHMFPTWWKGYFRLAMAYKASEKYQMALKNLILAQRFHDDPKKLDDQINQCKRLFNRLNREEHFDPQYFYKTYEEIAQIIPNSTSESLRERDNIFIKFNGATGLCTQGHNYYYGRSVHQDYKEAAKWYGKAAAEGNAEGLYNLGRMYLDGKGVICNFDEGIRLLEQAASRPNLITLFKEFVIPNLGVGEAQHSLGLLCHEGKGLFRDYEKAKYWYTRAIKNWSGSSANNIAALYLYGNGVPSSLDLAFHYWKLGAVMGCVRSMENLVYFNFELGDFENMQRWYLYALEHGSVALKLGSALTYQERFQETITQNFNKDNFTTALWSEIENGPLKHLIDAKVKAAHDKLYQMRQHSGIPRVPVHKIDSSPADEYRKSITLAHRKFIQLLHDYGKAVHSWGGKANLNPKPVTDLFNLKPIYLEEMKVKNKDHIYEGFVLKLTIIEDTFDTGSETTAINTIVTDEQKSYQRLFIYNYHPNKNDLQKTLGFGSKISIVNPYYRIAADGSPAIRVDDFDTLFVHSSLKNVKICRYCGDENYQGLPVPCRTCKRCYYCSKKCLKLDALELQHNLICKKKI